MNRTYINLLCILIIVVLSASVIVPSIGMTTAFLTGMNAGMSDTPDPTFEQTISTTTPITVQMSDAIILPNDSICLDSGHVLHASHQTMMVYVPDSRYSVAAQCAVIILGLLCIAATIVAMVQLIKFVVKVNRNVIFDRRNMRHLSIIGLCLLCVSLLQIFSGLIKDTVVSGLGTVGGYTMTGYWTIPWSNMLIGLVALLMAQIWRRGLQLKEDQELTI